jgi:magnesium-transporting ATPase (P-type)
VIVGIGLLFILIAIAVGVFKQTWLISGVNTMSREKKAKMDLDYVAKYFGLIFGILGGIMFLGVFICTYFGIMNYFHRSMPFLILGFCAFLILFFNVFKRKRIYNKNAGQTETDLQSKSKSKMNWRTIILIATVVPVGLLIYLSYKEPKAIIDANSFKLKGIYGVNLPFAEIAEADTITWNKMPAISIRTNGISLNKVNRGKFRTTDGEKIHLSIHRGVSPVIRIVESDGSVY